VKLIFVSKNYIWMLQVEIARNRVNKWAVVDKDESNNTSMISS